MESERSTDKLIVPFTFAYSGALSYAVGAAYVVWLG
jgi:hypothetical protein